METKRLHFVTRLTSIRGHKQLFSVSAWMASNKRRLENLFDFGLFSFSLFHPAPSLSVTFSFHLSLFPVGLTSLCLCFSVLPQQRCGLWGAAHPYSKQHSEAQMLTHKRRSIRLSNLSLCKQQMRGTPVTSACEQFVYLLYNLIYLIFEDSLWWSCIVLNNHSINFSSMPYWWT